MTEVRCVKCNRLLCRTKGSNAGEIEVKCPKCHLLHVYKTQRYIETMTEEDLKFPEVTIMYPEIRGIHIN